MDARRTNGIDKEKLSYIFIEFYATGLHLHKLSRPLKTYLVRKQNDDEAFSDYLATEVVRTKELRIAFDILTKQTGEIV